MLVPHLDVKIPYFGMLAGVKCPRDKPLMAAIFEINVVPRFCVEYPIIIEILKSRLQRLNPIASRKNASIELLFELYEMAETQLYKMHPISPLDKEKIQYWIRNAN